MAAMWHRGPTGPPEARVDSTSGTPSARPGRSDASRRPVFRHPDLPAPGRGRDGPALRRTLLAKRPRADPDRVRRLQPNGPGEVLSGARADEHAQRAVLRRPAG